MKKILFAFIVVAFLFTCSASIYYLLKALTTELSQPVNAEELADYHFVVIPEEVNNEYWRLVEKGARDAAQHYGVSIEYTGPFTANVGEHIKSIEKAVAGKADGVITQALIEEEFTPLFDQMIQKGTPIVTIDTDAPKSKRMAYIGTNNYYAGVLAGKETANELNGVGRIAIITGSFHSANQQLRVQGFKDVIEEYEDMEIVAIEESNISLIQAAERTYQIMNEHTNISAFYGTSALDAIGVASVLQSLDKNRNIFVIGFDILPDTLDLIRDGSIDATVVQEPYEMGYRSIEVMLSLVQGKRVSEFYYTDTGIIRQEDLKKVDES
ncbi:sugar-binding protein [Halalkalibacter hemicellulosilyticus]|uniref:Sugar ABC transporter n=1 Tax=Halalkalibacter hemicellulosilyticusJCM 9152 TaxID=1236971 RepID=W4QE91_9BACI|nr:sugar-binding protein [Halalkalibacter hemicellulosilyticus]GAE29679.1 sugar ABC transporter [Halalkalibacter hemicellulosilyticusJCM 9152]